MPHRRTLVLSIFIFLPTAFSLPIQKFKLGSKRGYLTQSGRLVDPERRRRSCPLSDNQIKSKASLYGKAREHFNRGDYKVAANCYREAMGVIFKEMQNPEKYSQAVKNDAARKVAAWNVLSNEAVKFNKQSNLGMTSKEQATKQINLYGRKMMETFNKEKGKFSSQKFRNISEKNPTLTKNEKSALAELRQRQNDWKPNPNPNASLHRISNNFNATNTKNKNISETKPQNPQKAELPLITFKPPPPKESFEIENNHLNVQEELLSLS